MKSHWMPLLPLFACLASCALNVEEEKTAARTVRPRFERDRPVAFERFLVLMGGDQRQAFFELRTFAAKERFLKEHGLTVKRMLADNIRLGMTTQTVQGLLGRPVKEEKEEHSVLPGESFRRVVDEWWVYQNPRTGNLVFIPFRRGWVVDWLLEPDVREVVMNRPTAGDHGSLRQKQDSLIHVQEKMPDLLRKPGEERQDYVARMRRVAPILLSKGPPKWPEPIKKRAETTDFNKEKVSKQEVYSWWGDTSKLFETPAIRKPPHAFSSYTRWTYKIFNGYGYIFYSLYFRDNRLSDWEVETDIGR